jgi:hypothetical protein
MMCDHAFLDREQRLCMIGISSQFSSARLPIAVNQVMLVARLADIRPVDEIAVSVTILTPAGSRATPLSSEGIVIEIAGEYVLVTLRGLPLTQEGVYRFQVALSGGSAVSLDIPVLTASPAPLGATH